MDIEKPTLLSLLCKRFKIYNYTINDDNSIDVNGDVDISSSNLSEIPIKFNFINGGFSCSYNKLTSLKNSPKSITGSFECYSNKLTSLEGTPLVIGANFDCRSNLIGISDIVTLIKTIKHFDNDLESILHCDYKNEELEEEIRRQVLNDLINNHD